MKNSTLKKLELLLFIIFLAIALNLFIYQCQDENNSKLQKSIGNKYSKNLEKESDFIPNKIILDHPKKIDNFERLGKFPIYILNPDKINQIKDKKRIREFNIIGSKNVNLYKSRVKDVRKLRLFPNLKKIWFENTKLTHSTIRELAKLNKIEELGFFGTNLDGGKLSRLKKMKTLKTLFIKESQVKDEDLSVLKDFPSLKKLHIGDTHGLHKHYPYIYDEHTNFFSNKALIPLKKVKNLEFLEIDRTTIDSEGLRHLKNIENLKELWLLSTEIRVENLKYFKNLKKLYFIPKYSCKNLDLTPFNTLKKLTYLEIYHPNAGLELFEPRKPNFLAPLKSLKSLSTLKLLFISVDDKSIEILKEMKNLKYILFHQTLVSKDGVKQLQKALPHCKIILKSPVKKNDIFLYSKELEEINIYPFSR